jgi:tyrocidine synthetase III
MIRKTKPTPKNVESIVSLTPVQEGMLFHYLKNTESDLYFEQLSLDISGHMNMNAFKKAWKLVIETNEMLRTLFRWEKLKSPVQITLKMHDLNLRLYDFTNRNSHEAEEWSNTVKIWDREEPFNLEEVPFRVTLCHIELDKYELIISNHHILYDGWSSGIILEEFFHNYDQLVTNPDRTEVIPGKTKFKQFIKWLGQQKTGERKSFWKQYLSNYEGIRQFPLKYLTGTKKNNHATRTYHSWLPAELREGLEEFIKQQKITLAAFYYGIWGILLQRYTNCNDVLFGATVSGRSTRLKGIEKMVGLFINTLPFRATCKQDEKTAQFMSRIQKDMQARELFVTTPLVTLKEFIPSGGDLTFDTLVVVDNYPLSKWLKSKQALGGLFINAYSVFESPHYDLTIGVTTVGEIGVDFLYRDDIFEDTTIASIAEHFYSILSDIIKNPNKEIHKLDLLKEKEKKQLLLEFNNSYRDYPQDQTVLDLIKEQINHTPDRIALVSISDPKKNHKKIQVSYRWLSQETDHLAHQLRLKGVGPDAIVAITIERSIEMIVGILAILKSGGAYMPIDPNSPRDRIDYILKDSNAALCIDKNSYNAYMSNKSYWSHLPIPRKAQPSDLCYVIYTSGSTGRPKGVLVEHKNLFSYINAFLVEFDITQKTTVVQQASFTFDTFAEEIYPVMVKGGRIVIPRKDDVRDVAILVDIIAQQAITMIDCSPLLLAQLNQSEYVERLKSISLFISGGDVLKGEYVVNLLPIGELYNTYGPTETTICASYYWCHTTMSGSISIGKPITNYNISILDKYNNLQPIGVPGELCIIGDGVSRGYLNQPELTQEKFLPGLNNGVSSFGSQPSSLFMQQSSLYKTGDLACWLSNGNIEFLGRIDMQIKIRGYRIELEEIECQLKKHEDIIDTAVVAKEDDNGDRYICAYIVYQKEKIFHEPMNRILSDYLSTHLPEYMIPAYFTPIGSIPLTNSGKLNRHALPEPEKKDTGETFTAPRDDLEKNLTGIWTEVLDIDINTIGIDSHFFRMGGHSLKASAMVARVHKELNIKIPLTTIFEKPFIRKLAEYIRTQNADKYNAITPVEQKEYYPLASPQKRLYILQQMAETATGYNMTEFFEAGTDLDTNKLDKVFQTLIQRHESLRTSFQWIKGEPVQRIHNDVSFEIEYFSDPRIPGDPNSNKQNHNSYPILSYGNIRSNFIRPFDLSKAPLMRVGLQTLDDNRYILMVDMHHIISDGISHSILVKDFAALYKSKSLPPLKLNYKDYSQWQQQAKREGVLQKQEQYWLNHFEEGIEPIELPMDYKRSQVQNFEGAFIPFNIKKESVIAIKKLIQSQDTTLYILLLAIYTIFLTKLSDREQIVIGTPVEGRNHADLESVMGMFVNTLAIKIETKQTQTFNKFLIKLKQSVLEALENRDYSFEDLVDQITLNREAGRNPLFDVMFALETNNENITPLFLKRIPLIREDAKFDLTLSVEEKDNIIDFQMEYATSLFKKETIQRFIIFFKQVLYQVLNDPGIEISQLEILPNEEKEKILTQFNNTQKNIPKRMTIHKLFENQSQQTPDQIAAINLHSENTRYRNTSIQLSFKLLNEKADQLTKNLKDKGVTPGAIIAVKLNRSIELLITVLGIWKAGGIYLPISTHAPQARIDYIIKDSGASFYLDNNSCRSYKSDETYRVIEYPEVANSHDFAYIIYTSGTTGKPKGVPIQHNSIVNRMYWMQQTFQINNRDVVMQKTAITFDVSICEMTRWILGGSRVYIMPEGGEKDPEEILNAIRFHQITIIEFVPSMLRLFLDHLLDSFKASMIGCLRLVFVGGETISRSLVDKFNETLFRSYGVRLINAYGPTEATVDVSCFDCSRIAEEKNVPIGAPMNNVRIHILNSQLQLQPIGISGELCITGKSLAPGYLNRPELSAEKFRPNTLDTSSPFSTQTTLLYRTGDMARWLPNGNIEFLGRIDQQLKLRGFRIEPEEIQRQLIRHIFVKDAVVVAKSNNNPKSFINKSSNEKFLCAYYEIEQNKTNESDTPKILREYLANRLPDYMIPAYFIALQNIPLTLHGKVDINALPLPNIANKSESYSTPRDSVEERLVDIWADVLELNHEQIGIDDNFFHLGGHSLKAVILVANIHKTMGTKIPLPEIFKTPHIRGLSKFINKKKKNSYSAIQATEIQQFYPLSSAQKRLYVLYQMDEQGVSYNMPIAIELNGTIDRDRLSDTYRKLIRRHDSLRTSFITVNEEPVQLIAENLPFEVWYYRKTPNGQWSLVLDEDLELPQTTSTAHSLLSSDQPHSVPPSVIIERFIRPFDLSFSPLLRAGLMKIEAEKYILLVDMHHIISDGVSTGILISDFISLYSGKELPTLQLQYKDYSQWQRRKRATKSLKKQANYWLTQFDGEIPVLELPTDFPRPSIQNFIGDIIQTQLSIKESENLKRMAQEKGVTIFMLLLAIYNVFLGKISGQEDIVVGTPAAGRRHIDLEPIIGLFIDTLALRNFPIGELTFTHFLNNLKYRAITAFENQDFNFEDIVEKVAVGRDTSRNPLFDTMFLLDTMDLEMQTTELEGLKVKAYEYTTETSKFDLTLTAVEKGPIFTLEFEYCTALFKKSTAQRLATYFNRVVSAVLKYNNTKIRDIQLLTKEEKQKIMEEFNRTHCPYPLDNTLYHLFASQAEKSPSAIAILESHQNRNIQLSYRQLHKDSDKLAHHLKEQGIGPNTITAIMMKRSFEMIISILAILKTGAAYLPIDPHYPKKRIDFMLKDSAANFCMDDKSYQTYRSNGADKIYELPVAPKSHDLAYIIYTSGSTGNPKGVIVEHHSAVNLIHGLAAQYPLTSIDTYLFKTPVIFDVSVSELFGWYIDGGRLAILNPGAEKDPQEIMMAIDRCQVTHINFVPSMFNVFVDGMEPEQEYNKKLSSLKYIFLAGEALLPGMVKRFQEKNSRIPLENLYGPTEATVYTTGYSLQHWNQKDNVSIGKPLDNTRIYILDKWDRPQPIGVTGELCISGICLARGYLNNPELTNQKFLSSSFITHNSELLYRTGDLACWLPDGNIDYLGRIDHQVKIRGYRIELGEIEGLLTEHEQVKEAVIVVRQDKSGDKYLCAYIIFKGKKITPQNLKKYLSDKLPEYMLPTYFVKLNKFPLKPSGKLDKQALPPPEIILKEKFTAPQNETENKLTAMWSEILNIPQKRIGTTANFFQLGGHSLKATVLSSRIRKEFHVAFTLSSIFSGPTIQECAKLIGKATKKVHEIIEPREKKEYYPQSSAQKRLFILEHFEDIGIAYNMPIAFRILGSIDSNHLQNTLEKLIQRHESLRTSFFMAGDQPVQKIHDKVKFKIDLQTICGPGRLPYDEIINAFVKPFDLSKAPLIRVGLAQVLEGTFLLMADMHHIIGDGVSTEILMDEFIGLYNNESLAPLAIQYKDFSLWQIQVFKDGHIKEQEDYWLERYHDANDIPRLNLPTDYPRPAIFNFEGDSLGKLMDEETSAAFKHLGANNGSTLYMLLLSVLDILLFKYSRQEDIIIGGVVAGRRHANLQDIVGMFVNTLPMRDHPNDKLTYLDFLNQVRANSLKSFESQDVPFETLVENLHLVREPSRNPLFDICLAVQNFQQAKIGGNSGDIIIADDGIQFSPIDFESNVSQFDLSVTAINRSNGLYFHIVYCTRIFKKETIKRFMDHFNNIVTTICHEPNIPIADIDILSKKEKIELLETFNGSQIKYPKEKTLDQLFKEQVAKSPDRIAIKSTSTLNHISYQTLNQKALHLASILNKQGVTNNSIVAINMEQSPELIISIFATLIAGAAYLPIEPKYPKERINFILKDSNAALCLEKKSYRTYQSYQPYKTNERPVHVNCHDLAYIIYTSGSTGKPKGVLVEHCNVITNLYAFFNEFEITANDIGIQLASFTFDVFTEELYPILMRGGTILIPTKKEILDIDLLVEIVSRHNVTLIDGVPQMLYEFNKRSNTLENSPFNAVHTFISGGDTLKTEYIDELLKTAKVYNTYGPTEATVCATYYRCTEMLATQPPIGKPIANYHVYILDPNQYFLPIGVAGELCIAGDGVARGYLNRPELTYEKFISRIFDNNSEMGRYSSCLYRSGDLAQWLLDGNIEFLGRIDRQVKIRGFRIELGEIENQLLTHTTLKDVVVTASGKGTEKSLCAYFTTKNQNVPTRNDLKRFLANELPGYMVPSYFIDIETIPLTANGKINIKALPNPLTGLSHNKYKPPRSKLEKQIAKIWAEVLHLEEQIIGTDDNFFNMGGDSLKVIQTSSKLKKINIPIEVGKLFTFQTITQIATYLKSMQTIRSIKPTTPTVNQAKQEIITGCEKYSAAELTVQLEEILNKWDTTRTLPGNMKTKRQYKVSPVQKSNLLLSTPQILEEHNLVTIYDFLHTFPNETTPNKDEINHVVTTFINNNDLLHSVIIKTKVKPKEKATYLIREYEPFTSTIDFPYIDVSMYGPPERQQALYLSRNSMIRALKIIDHFLYRVLVLKWDTSHYKVIFSINHLIFDGASSRVLPERINAIRKKDITPHRDKTKDYYKYCQFIQQLDYSHVKLEKYLHLPTYIQSIKHVEDNFKIAPISYGGFEIDISHLNETLKNRYNQITILTYAQTIKQLFKVEDIPITVISHGRHFNQANFSGIIGDFHDYIPVLCQLKENRTTQEIIKKFLAYKKFCKQQNLNFIAYFIKNDTRKEDIINSLSPFFFNSLIGLYDSVKEETESRNANDILECNVEEEINDAPGLRPRFFDLEMVRAPHMDQLWINISQNSDISQDKIKDLFIHNFQQLVDSGLEL